MFLSCVRPSSSSAAATAFRWVVCVILRIHTPCTDKHWAQLDSVFSLSLGRATSERATHASAATRRRRGKYTVDRPAWPNNVVYI